MHDAVPPVISAWSSFYVITGSSAAALTGLMFIVVHFCVTPLVSAAADRAGKPESPS